VATRGGDHHMFRKCCPAFPDFPGEWFERVDPVRVAADDGPRVVGDDQTIRVVDELCGEVPTLLQPLEQMDPTTHFPHPVRNEFGNVHAHRQVTLQAVPGGVGSDRQCGISGGCGNHSSVSCGGG